MKAHLKSHEASVKQHRCQECGKGFMRKFDLMVRLVTKHQDLSNTRFVALCRFINVCTPERDPTPALFVVRTSL